MKEITKCRVTHIKNPRHEKETHQMAFENSKFLKVLDRPPTLMKEEIREMIGLLNRRKRDITTTTTSYSGSLEWNNGTGNIEVIN